MPYHDICGVCQSAYDYTPRNSRLYLFIEDAGCNHVKSKCPMGHEKWLYVKPYEATKMLFEVKDLPIIVQPEAGNAERTAAARAWAEFDGPVAQLYMDMDKWLRGG